MLSDLLKSFKIEVDSMHVDLSEDQFAIDMFDGEFVGQCSPIFRFAGSKTHLLSAIRFYSPRKFDNYFEPFIGGGALLFALMPKSAIINDINPVLTNLYSDVKERYSELLAILRSVEMLPDTEMVYLAARDVFNSYLTTKNYCIEMSALFLFLNAKCKNGLFLLNSNGEFNVGFDKESDQPIYSPENLKYVHDYLNSNAVTILSGDFAECTKLAKQGDFVYFDPPDTLDEFDIPDHVRLFNDFDRLSKQGVKCLLSISDCEFIRNLYSGYKFRLLNNFQPTSDELHQTFCLIMNF